MKPKFLFLMGLALLFNACTDNSESFKIDAFSTSEFIPPDSITNNIDAQNENNLVLTASKPNSIWHLFDTSLWPARWNCGTWSDELGWLHISSDIAIWLAYFTIPILFGYFYYHKHPKTTFNPVLLLFLGFIIASGVTHLVDAVIFWWPVYNLSAFLRLGTALISWGSVFALVKTIPKAMDLRDPQYLQSEVDSKTLELTALNEQLLREVKSKESLAEQLESSNTSLATVNEALIDSNALLNDKFMSVVENSAIGIAITSIKGEFLEINNALDEMLGYDDLKSKTLQEITHPDDLSLDLEYLNEMIALKRKTYEIQKRYFDSDNNIIWIQLNKSAVYSFDGQVDFFISQIQDISARKEAEAVRAEMDIILQEKVKIRTRQLEVINRELQSFSYSVSHDLRSPLRSIQGFSQALLEDNADMLDEIGKKHLQRVINASGRMSELIDDMLKLSRISRMEVKEEEIDISAMAKEILDLMIIDDKYEIEITPNIKDIGDPNLVKIALENLLGNAIKYSSKRDHPKIKIGVSDRRGYNLFIEDNGVGFDMNFTDKLFGAFQRLHRKDEFEGTGIGLATVKRIINQHGGNIKAEAEVNMGAKFYIAFNQLTIKK